MQYVQIPNGDLTETYETNTDEQRELAREAMRYAELVELPIWVGEPGSPDTYKNGAKLFA